MKLIAFCEEADRGWTHKLPLVSIFSCCSTVSVEDKLSIWKRADGGQVIVWNQLVLTQSAVWQKAWNLAHWEVVKCWDHPKLMRHKGHYKVHYFWQGVSKQSCLPSAWLKCNSSSSNLITLIALVLADLHWFAVCQRIYFNILSFVFMSQRPRSTISRWLAALVLSFTAPEVNCTKGEAEAQRWSGFCITAAPKLWLVSPC